MSETLARVERAVLDVERVAIFLVFLSLVAVLFLQVLFRFVIERPLDFTEELSRVLIVWLVFLSAANAITKAEHFVVDVVVNFLPPRLFTVVAYVIDAVCIAFMMVAAWVSYRAAVGGAGQTLPTLQVSVIVQTLAMPVGFALMLFHSAMLLLRYRHIGEPANVPPPDAASPGASGVRAQPEGRR